jgi:hypothetical protein
MSEMIKPIYGESIMSKSNVFKWHKSFREIKGASVSKRKDRNVTKIRELV